MINMGGIAFAFRAMEETTVSAAAVARAFVVMRKIWDLDSVTQAIAQLPASTPSEHGSAVALDMRRLLDRSVRWYVTHDFRDKPIADALERLEHPMSLMRGSFTGLLHGINLAHSLKRLAHTDAVGGLPRPLGGIRASELLVSYGLLDISAIARSFRNRRTRWQRCTSQSSSGFPPSLCWNTSPCSRAIPTGSRWREPR